MGKKILISLLTLGLTACGNINDLEKFSKKESPLPVEEVTPFCKDFNALNAGGDLPCHCPIDYDLSLDGEKCFDKPIFAKVHLRTTNATEVLKDTYTTGTIEIDPNGLDPSWEKIASMRIKGRGHSTWEFPKKPYKIKLDSSSSIMGMPKDKEWVFLANYTDKTLMRNMLADELGKKLQMAYTPRYKTVELTLNDRYVGVYLLTEQVKVAEKRVNAISTDITGGYLIELDYHTDNEFFFTTDYGVPYAIKEPEEPTFEQQEYIKNYFQLIEYVLNSPDFSNPVSGYAKYIDVDSFINWYLVNEIFKNSDAANYSSIYFHKSSNEKLKMGPLWDFDLAIGNINYTDAQYSQGWWIRTHSVWFKRLFEDPLFERRVKDRWNQLTKNGSDLYFILDIIDQKAFALNEVQENNFIKWNILNSYVWPNRVVSGSYEGEVIAMKDWLTLRLQWMNSQFNP